MKPQGKNIIFKTTGCPGKEQLLLYTKNELPVAEKHHVEAHLVDCELCSDAVEGFALLSGTAVLDETVARVRSLANDGVQPPVRTSARVWMVAASIAVVTGFTVWLYYQLYKPDVNSIALSEKTVALPVEKPLPPPPAEINNAEPLIEAEKEMQTVKNNADQAGYQANESSTGVTASGTESNTFNWSANTVASSAPAEELSNDHNTSDQELQISAANNSYRTTAPAVAGQPVLMDEYKPVAKKSTAAGEVRYIEGLKTISFNDAMNTDSLLTPNEGIEAIYENAESKKEAKSRADTRVRYVNYNAFLTQGMHYFKMQQYQQALDIFNKILAARIEDQNALFYGALSLDALNRYAEAKNQLARIIVNRYGTFYEEAKWNMALIYLKEGNKTEGAGMLREIVAEKGFYSQRAAEKLSELK